MYMLQLNADLSVEDSDIIKPALGNLLIDSTLNQFNLMIGEYKTDSFTKHPNPALCYALFIITVVISQITYLNMLIAIISGTFERVIEQQPTFSLKNKLIILAAMESMIRSKEANDDAKVFLYVIHQLAVTTTKESTASRTIVEVRPIYLVGTYTRKPSKNISKIARNT